MKLKGITQYHKQILNEIKYKINPGKLRENCEYIIDTC
jgi:hypothetical protein